MKLKLFLFVLLFAAIGQTIFLNIDAKMNFLEEKSKNAYTILIENESTKLSEESSEVVVTIRQQGTENTNSDTEESVISMPLGNKKPCVQKTKQERLICQKAKEAAKQKQNRFSGSNQAKTSTIQTP